MNRKVAKLIRGFCKMTNQPYRAMKRGYSRMKPENQRDAKIELLKFWEQSETQGLIDHKRYYDLKETLEVTLAKRRMAEATAAANEETLTA